ncbi:MAG TPA: epoxide hydrolase [Pyrinomonadaceae bacterium]|nr:epoxide hydrolase [Pyrinomonadaceae bacterium]
MKQPVKRSRRRFLKVSSILGLAVAFSPRTIANAFVNSRSRTNKKEEFMTDTGAARQGSDKSAIRPFQFNFTDAELTDLRKRINATKWPERELVSDASQGVQLATMQKLAGYWGKNYDWRKGEAKLKAVPHFITEIDGLDIHFIHVRSKHENALPMIVTHGWPGSIIEQMKIIEPLTNPTAHGGTAEDAFHLVIPSLPGYGFSGKPTKPGWNPVSIAKAWAILMQRLGYTKYVAQGGDWGNAVSETMALQEPPGLLGIHTNMAATIPSDVSKALAMGGPPPEGLTPDEKHAWDQLVDFYKNGLGYALEMNNRPQTLYGIVDSPVGLAAWMIDHDIRSYQMIGRAFDGKPEGLTRDDVLDNVTLYWLTNTAISSAQLYWDTRHTLPPGGGFFDVRGIKIPVAVSAFAEEIYQAPKSWAEKAYAKLIFYNKHDKGTHFAAWEQPELFVTDLRAAFKSLRPSRD